MPFVGQPYRKNNSSYHLLNQQCCRVIQDTKFNVRSGINTDLTDNHSNNTISNEKTNKQTNSYKKNDETTVNR